MGALLDINTGINKERAFTLGYAAVHMELGTPQEPTQLGSPEEHGSDNSLNGF